MLKELAALVGFLLVMLLAYALLGPQQPRELTSGQAEELVLQDLVYLIDAGNEVEVTNVTPSDRYAWEVVVRIVDGQHSICPTVIKRFYTLSPFGYRPEDVIITCNEKVSILYREEALINAGLLDEVRSLPNRKGCAFYVASFNAAEAYDYCPWLEEAALRGFVQDLPPESWVTQWTGDGGTIFVAFAANSGQRIK
ncbi:hypothetical protein COX85_03135 [Candidatus Micrarchaeota archaeon CG_4_10_14_0_2_um_filter_55_9]|nr:MAG: hypothetical protein AUJ15_02480 [Candidatus Micrarchaeota archaeon CG1_02_55_41]PIO03863.1 MAG: hypothetical protein COT57_00295 [Candidatus Micrarchaeota archaeon CG09_land_8_20_14_0_10_55_25]PIZ91584.1 MAG: hypothetical protein COX85_03135 [Candidatus Micrarchaeota archaeon CG_4_10_14_0_2_um_filter_55_9]PJD00986.1 MAG: hypothetical protein COU38_03355 [Candidatus Micrarchaeota archaeon CG10_big_fil_rev_8_21_14_0_10_54_18]